MQLNQPLASLIRPRSLADFVGQSHLVGPNQPLRLAIDNRQVFSMIFWGPPGVGKTTLARIIAKEAKAEIFELSAVSAGKDDIRKIVSDNRPSLVKKILFLDEIHRFNKAQQDYLLPFVESGALTLIGATTENPSFEVISPLLSRCRVFVLKELSNKEMGEIIDRCLVAIAGSVAPQTPSVIGRSETTTRFDSFGQQSHQLPSVIARSETTKQSHPKSKVTMSPSARDWLTQMANGDARQCITMIDNAYTLYGKLTIDSLKSTLQNSYLRFDKKGEEHYNTISAFIKSMRASNIDAAIYYLARMIEAGEDPKFIARRMVVFASEDIGLANPNALLMANEVFRTCETIGYPECAINLAHGVAYLANSPKSRAVYDALLAAKADVAQFGNLPIPLNLRNAPTKLMKNIGYGKGYEMYSKKDLLPEKLKGKKYFKS